MLLICGLVILPIIILMSAWWIAKSEDYYSLVDAFWAFSFLGTAFLGVVLGTGLDSRKVTIAAMLGFWSFRLGWHLAHRMQDHFPDEDARYVVLRELWKGQLPSKFRIYFFVQAISVVIMSAAFLPGLNNPEPMGHYEFFGVLIFIFGLFGEWLSDKQLKIFKEDIETEALVCDRGLWRYSRHPNYFFEWLTWVGHFVFLLGSPKGWIAFYLPVLMYILLNKVTGIPFLESQQIQSKGDEYLFYQKTTSAFFPWFKKKLKKKKKKKRVVEE